MTHSCICQHHTLKHLLIPPLLVCEASAAPRSQWGWRRWDSGDLPDGSQLAQLAFESPLSEAAAGPWRITLNRLQSRQPCHLPPLAPYHPSSGLPAGHLFREAGGEAEKLDKKAGTWFQVARGQRSQVWWR